MVEEWILNSATNRFQLNFARNVGRVSEEIRKMTEFIRRERESLLIWQGEEIHALNSPLDQAVERCPKGIEKVNQPIAEGQ
ncbi:MAG: MjaI family restriction endonuclease [Candidatus Thermoplasmatota archaeon]|nr:MjaI family restriction endonuclease [Candidatus Thermoplasmatota archaeon]MCL5889263.1 MjaI family restriction endonuclease [Candidatus Thermoplasmatota archaeon]